MSRRKAEVAGARVQAKYLGSTVFFGDLILGRIRSRYRIGRRGPRTHHDGRLCLKFGMNATLIADRGGASRGLP